MHKESQDVADEAFDLAFRIERQDDICFLEEVRFLEPGIIDKYFDENGMSKIERTFDQFIEGGKIHEYSKWSNDVKGGER